MLILGFDYGTRYIGIAVGQEITKTATPLTSIFIKNKKDVHYVYKYIYIWKPSKLIIGYPDFAFHKNKNVLHHINFFMKNLKSEFNIPTFTVNETLSTWESKKRLFYYKKKCDKKYFLSVNAMAASIIVEQWLSNIK